ncbi:hypothetical protein FRC12_010197 [Ceratobasidium sp. 428]|nr:hypothetical protein FRC12_010197 [Ceratobasidium sp. 428]
MDADYLLRTTHFPLAPILGVISALAVMAIFLAFIWDFEPSISIQVLLQHFRRALLYPAVLVYRLYFYRDRLFISIPLGTQIETSYYVEEDPNQFFSVDQIGTLVFALPGIIWVRYSEENRDEIRSHLLLNTMVSLAQTPTPLQTIRSNVHPILNRAARSLSLDLHARTSLNIIPQSSLPELAYPTPLRTAIHIALSSGLVSPPSVRPHNRGIGEENIDSYGRSLAPTPPPSPQSVANSAESVV